MAIFNYDGTVNSPLNGKKVIWIGDSNTDYNRELIKAEIEKLGGTLHSYALAGYAWEDTNLTDSKTLTNNCGIGQVNRAINDFVHDSRNIFDDDCIVIVMLGTNKYGELGEWNTTHVNTVRGACDYCLSKLAYYGRTIPIGIIIPWDGKDNEQLIERCKYYALPYIDLSSQVRIIPDNRLGEFGIPHLGGLGNHFEANGKIHFLRMIINWICYQI